ncbi:hypothetical protein ADN00_15650 [Ornatilinea apprima]|uniref:Uncharacterized protein n=1 Tax=Ornatilinea apprima TaxID=1134406 RepID=A0A0N8GLE2_9CHLR|nr:hypothetical protein [Ornatilinea apprima]KPL72250.1 hypothetical protein ADN00_15650 [Ornatilinea apprima]
MPPASLNTQKLNQVLDQVAELNRTIRGHNGTPGMLTQMAIMSQNLERLTEAVNNINQNGCNYLFRDENRHTPKEQNQQTEQKDEDKFWAFVRDKIAAPVAVALVLGLLSNLPKIILAFDQILK